MRPGWHHKESQARGHHRHIVDAAHHGHFPYGYPDYEGTEPGFSILTMNDSPLSVVAQKPENLSSPADVSS
ncbi:hypothetical protein Acor_29830 [Acrocarpospora corrugata]|uniref:Uncharacterized protein n=1 Tax=Acrocarpospora corrugata TaxID=35763 RepID=A0A5M3VXU7_9ACTN|nr:hypothetical protein Acor_29830 [Acrocarpospora corrugata]